jgi:predicted nicotinamide N-methyase
MSLVQPHVRTAYGIDFLLSRHKDIRRLKKEAEEPSIHGNKFWGSSYLIMDYLENNPIKKKSRVLELGCGWGLAGIHCAKHFNAEVTGVDADDAVFPYLHLHAQHNGVNVKTQKTYFEKISTKELANYDVIIGADICFWDELGDVLYNLINRAIKAGVKKIIIADPEREPFFTLAECCIKKNNSSQYHAEVESWSVDLPRRASGSLLIIESPP